MRHMLAVAIAAALFALPAAAQNKQTTSAIKGTGRYGAAGCGLGSLAFGDTPGGIQIIASTTNYIFWTQTFGITTGTSNCGPGMFAMGTKNLVEGNRDALAKDMARGEGEVIGALTVINACQDSRAVGAALQRDFKAIFPSEQATSDQITEAILKTLQSDRSLGCAKG